MDKVINQHTFWQLMHIIETLKLFFCFDPAFPYLDFGAESPVVIWEKT